MAIIKRPLVSFEIYFTPLIPSLISHRVTALTVAEVYCLGVYSTIADCKNDMKYITLGNLRKCLMLSDNSMENWPTWAVIICYPSTKKKKKILPTFKEPSGYILYSPEHIFSPWPESNPIHTLQHYIF